MVYMDNILIFTKTKAEHIMVVKQVLQTLRDNNLYLKPKKCEFHKEKLNYLGYTILKDYVAIEDSKVKAIEDWPVPCTVHDICSFLRLGHLVVYWQILSNCLITTQIDQEGQEMGMDHGLLEGVWLIEECLHPQTRPSIPWSDATI